MSSCTLGAVAVLAQLCLSCVNDMQIEQLQMQCCQLEKEAARREGDSEVARREAENKLAERTRVALREQQLEYEGQVSRLCLCWLCLHWLCLHWLCLHWLYLCWLCLHWLCLHWLCLHWLRLHWLCLDWLCLHWLCLQLTCTYIHVARSSVLLACGEYHVMLQGMTHKGSVWYPVKCITPFPVITLTPEWTGAGLHDTPFVGVGVSIGIGIGFSVGVHVLNIG